MSARTGQATRFARYDATGNRFLLADGLAGRAPDDPAAVAVAECVAAEVDGLLLLLAPRAGGDVRMVLYNRDGSRAEACGNGLRCVARHAVECGHVAGERLCVETDAGPMRVVVERSAGGVGRARAELGSPRVIEVGAALAVGGERVEATLVEVGNPHCVVRVADVERAPLATLGAALEGHARFPRRTNVGFVELAGDELRLRVWERGVGETPSCGTGAVAAAVATGLGPGAEIDVRTRGGRLRVHLDRGGRAWVAGPVRRLHTPLGATS